MVKKRCREFEWALIMAGYGVDSEHEHFVQFYENDEFLIQKVSSFIGDALLAGETGIVFATKPHLALIDQALKHKISARTEVKASMLGRYIALDAQLTLSSIVLDGKVDPQLFSDVIGALLAQACSAGPVRACGEMVALLCAQDMRDEALRLELLWNALARRLEFSLMCAYPIGAFSRQKAAQPYSDLCVAHAQAWPPEFRLPLADLDDQPNTVAELQRVNLLLAFESERRKWCETTLLHTQRQLLSIQGIAHAGSWTLNRRNGAMQWCDEFFRICGRAPHSARPSLRLALQMVHSEDRAALLKACRTTQRYGNRFELALRIVRPDGAIRHLHCVAEVLPDRALEDGLVLGTMLDVTDKKLADDALRCSEDRFRSLVNASSHWYWETDQDARLTRLVHHAANTQQWIGCSHWELPGARWDDAARLVLEADIAARRGFANFDFCVLCADGARQYLQISGDPVYDGAGQFAGYRGLAENVSERVQLEKNLQLFRHAMDETADAIFVLDHASHKFFDVNTTVCRMLGYTRAQLLLLGPVDIGCGPRDKLERGYHELINGKDLGLLEVTLQRKDGSRCVVEMHRIAQRWGDRWMVIEMARDISERKRTEQVLQQSQQALRQLVARQDQIKEEERKRIAREIHDELGQNLLALRIDVSMLHARSLSTHPLLRKKVQIVLDNVDATIGSVKAIINDLRPQTLELGLHAAFEWQLKQFERLSGIQCQLVVNEKNLGDPLDDGRTLAIFRILQESLTNIARHAKATQVGVVLSINETRILMTVSDNGIGFHPNEQRSANGFGLVGISERLFALGGELMIDSLKDNGTVLSVTIPLEPCMLDGWDRRREDR